MAGLSEPFFGGYEDMLSSLQITDTAASARALERLLNVSSLQNVSCDAVQQILNRTMQCQFVGMTPDCSRHVSFLRSWLLVAF